MCKDSTLPHLQYMYAFFPVIFVHQFLCIYIKMFYKFPTMSKVIQDRNAFLM